MDAKTAGREYSDFEPTTNWAREDKFDTLLVYLPGFRKEKLKVQITSAGNLRIMGERQVSGNKWSRFRKEMPILSTCDSNKISAKFDNGILHVKLPKIIVPAEPRGGAKPAVQPTRPPEPTPTAEPRKKGQKEDIKEPPKAGQVPAIPTEEEKKPPKAEQAPAKPMEQEKKPKKSAEVEEKPKEVKEESKRADEAQKGLETALQQKKSENLAEKKATEKDQKRGDTADIGKKMEKTGTKNADDIGKPKAENYKDNIGNLVAKLKKPRNLMKAMVAALLIVVVGLYVKHALRSLGTTESDPEL